MTIRPGQAWGVPEVAPLDTTWFASDRALGRALDQGCRGPIGLSAGDLVTITGQSHARSSVKVSIDALVVRYVEGTTGKSMSTHAISWVSIGSWWSRGGLHVVSNSGLVAGDEWFSRAHPNDGSLDGATIDGAMPFRQRFLARRRVASGAPFSHPQIRSIRATQYHWAGRPTSLVVDGERIARVTSVEVEVLADALVVYVGSPSTGV